MVKYVACSFCATHHPTSKQNGLLPCSEGYGVYDDVERRVELSGPRPAGTTRRRVGALPRQAAAFGRGRETAEVKRSKRACSMPAVTAEPRRQQRTAPS